MAEHGSRRDIVLGLYDPHSHIEDLIKSHVAEDIDIVVTPALESNSPDVPITYLGNKELLLQRSTHLIIMMEDLGSLSILTGAIRRLLDGQLKRIMAVGEVPLEMLLRAAEHDGKEALLKTNIESGRFLIVRSLKPMEIGRFLANE